VRAIVRLLETLTNKNDHLEVEQLALKFMPLIQQGGETPELVIASYFHAVSLYMKRDIRAAHETSAKALVIAERLGDGRAKAYARSLSVFMRTFLGLDSLDVADRMKSEMTYESLHFGDKYVRNWTCFYVAFDYFYPGLMKEAREAAYKLIVAGEETNDPRPIGQANLMLGYIGMFEDDLDSATAHAEECIRVAVTRNERQQGAMIKAVAEVLSGRASSGLADIMALNTEFERSGSLIMMQLAPYGVALVMLGRISEGFQTIEQEITQSDATGDQTRAAWGRVILAEIYIEILSGKEKPAVAVLLKNFWAVIGATIFGAKRARALLQQAAATKMLSEGGVFIARINFDLGVLSAMKKKRAEARTYFEKARVAAESQGADKLLRKADAALAELE
jgi:hypothetical protein